MTFRTSGLRMVVTLVCGLTFVGLLFLCLLAMATHHRVASNLAGLGVILAGYGVARALEHGNELDSKVRRQAASEASWNSIGE